MMTARRDYYFWASDQQRADELAALVECARCGAVYHKASRHQCQIGDRSPSVERPQSRQERPR